VVSGFNGDHTDADFTNNPCTFVTQHEWERNGQFLISDVNVRLTQSRCHDLNQHIERPEFRIDLQLLDLEGTSRLLDDRRSDWQSAGVDLC
jgi:hypothetical protein